MIKDTSYTHWLQGSWVKTQWYTRRRSPNRRCRARGRCCVRAKPNRHAAYKAVATHQIAFLHHLARLQSEPIWIAVCGRCCIFSMLL